MAFKNFFSDAIVKNIPNAEKPKLGSDPTADNGSAIPGAVSPKDISDGKSLWHSKGSKS